MEVNPWLVDKRSKNIFICGQYLYLSDNNDYYDYNTVQLVATVIGAIKDTATCRTCKGILESSQDVWHDHLSPLYICGCAYACGV